MQRILLCFISSFFIMPVFSQIAGVSILEKQIQHGNAVWYQLKTAEPTKASQFFSKYAFEIGLTEQTEMKLVYSNTESKSVHHYKFQQYHNGIRVLGAEMILHESNGNVETLNGTFGKNLSIETNAKIESHAVLDLALKLLPSTKYVWENDASLYPKPELLIMDKAFPENSGDFILVYKVDIYSLNPFAKMRYYFNAENGELVLSHSILHACFGGIGDAHTLYHGIRPMETSVMTTGRFELVDNTRGNGIETMSASGRKYTDGDNIWEKDSFPQRKGALDVHFGSQSTYDYYKNHFNRNGIDGKNGKLINRIVDSVTLVNAFWEGAGTLFGIGDNKDTGPLTSLDVVAHEMTHGVTQFTCGLEYLYECGALNEGFSDIFGKAVEFEYDSANFNWLLGSRFFFKPDTAFRSLSNPNRFKNPKNYKGSFWVANSSDNGGVHSNSGVINHWFYLLVEGGIGTNETGKTYNVEKIGMDAAIQLVYNAMTNYLISTSFYFDVREATLTITENQYGKCSKEYRNIAEAWKAVGMGLGVTEADLLLVNNKIPLVTCKEGLYPVEVRLVNQSCDKSYPAGTDIQFSIQITGKNPIIENYTSTQDLLPGESFIYKFLSPARIDKTNTRINIYALLPDDIDTSNNRVQITVTKNNNSDHDFRVNSLNISGSPCENKQLRATVNANFNGCSPVPAGTELDLVLKFDNQEIIKKVKTVTTIYPGANYRSTAFDIDRTFAGYKRILATLGYPLDTVLTNNSTSFNAVYINNAEIGYLEPFDNTTFDSTLLGIKKDSFQVVNIHDIGTSPAIIFSGGKIFNAANSFIPTNGPTLANFMSSNPKFTSTLYLCVNTENLQKAILSFDYIHKLGTTVYDSTLLTSPIYAAATRIIFKNEQGTTIGMPSYISDANTELKLNYYESDIPLTGGPISIEITNITLDGPIDENVSSLEFKDYVLIDNLKISGEIVFTNQADQIKIQVDPNPFGDHILLSVLNEKLPLNYKLVNSLGSIAMQDKIVGNNMEIKTHELPTGTYILQIFNSAGILKSEKLIKL
ncbi:MAG: M4 family metallopeptidase [Saprospiraceae bacterium]|nr:M4 family metallopeptidase [Saprospiraceae bacterium]